MPTVLEKLPSYIRRALFSAFLVVLFWGVLAAGYCNDYYVLHPFLMAGLAAIAAAALWLAYKRRLTWENAALLIMAAGILIRIFFALAIPAWRMSHDFGDYTTDGYGHASYILYIYHYGELPMTNDSQFYHPPFFHILSALLMRLTAWLLPITDDGVLIQSTKIIACIASCLTLFFSRDICRELKLSEKASAITLTVASLLPIHFIFAKLVNNDSLVTMFLTMIILYTIRWYKEPSFPNILLLALAFGLGMFTKASCGSYAIPTGCVMLWKFLGSFREGKWKRYIAQFASFACISFPLGLFYPIRNYLLFGQTPGYVPIPWGGEYEVTETFFHKFISFPFGELFTPLWADPTTNYNLNLYLVKTSIFGEFTHKYVNTVPAYILLAVNFVLIILSLLCAAKLLVLAVRGSLAALSARRKRKGQAEVSQDSRSLPLIQGVCGYYLLGLWAFSYVMQMWLYYVLPYGCSMDFRYIVPTSLLGAICLGWHFGGWIEKSAGKIRRVLGYLFLLALAVFAVSSIWMYTGLYQYFDFAGRRYL